MAEANWYVVHTYSGYENKVKVDIEKTIENRQMQDQILEVSVPVETVVEVKNGVEKTADRKLFPGYVLIRMIMNDETWSRFLPGRWRSSASVKRKRQRPGSRRSWSISPRAIRSV